MLIPWSGLTYTIKDCLEIVRDPLREYSTASYPLGANSVERAHTIKDYLEIVRDPLREYSTASYPLC